jgi:DNA-binding MarR family transcriptional regulator
VSNHQLDEIHWAIECLQRLSNAFVERRQQLAHSVGLTDHQWGVLEEISTEHFMPSLFAKQRDSSAAAVSKTIRQLVDKGLVEVRLNKSDARQRDYQLTPKARSVIHELRRARTRAIEQVWLNLAIEEVRQFTAFGNRLTRALVQHANNTEKHEDDHASDALPESL